MEDGDTPTSSKPSRRSTKSAAVNAAEWHKFDIKQAPRNCEVFVGSNKNGARATVIIRGSEIFTMNGHRLPWEPTHICIPPEKLPK